MRAITLLTVLFLGFIVLKAQSNKLDLFTGYGYYENVLLGFKYEYKTGLNLGISVGSSLSLMNQDNYSLTLENNVAIAQSKLDEFNRFKWFLTGKIMYWKYEDEYYLYKVLTLSPAVTRNFVFNNRLYISIDFGPLFTIVLHNKRKTFEEVGWPYHVMPNIRVLLNFDL